MIQLRTNLIAYLTNLSVEAGTKLENILGGAEQNCYIDLTLL
jgi:hypothetical protein